MKKSYQRGCLFHLTSQAFIWWIYLSKSSSSITSFKVLSPTLPFLNWFNCLPVCSCCCCGKACQSCPTLCDPIDGSPPSSSVPGILQARTLEWVAIPFSSASKWKVKVKSLSRVRLLVTPWTAAYQASPSMGFSRQEYWSGLTLPSLEIRLKLCYLNCGPWNSILWPSPGSILDM